MGMRGEWEPCLLPGDDPRLARTTPRGASCPPSLGAGPHLCPQVGPEPCNCQPNTIHPEWQQPGSNKEAEPMGPELRLACAVYQGNDKNRFGGSPNPNEAVASTRDTR